jgi:hypothetical protein
MWLPIAGGKKRNFSVTIARPISYIKVDEIISSPLPNRRFCDLVIIPLNATRQRD